MKSLNVKVTALHFDDFSGKSLFDHMHIFDKSETLAAAKKLVVEAKSSRQSGSHGGKQTASLTSMHLTEDQVKRIIKRRFGSTLTIEQNKEGKTEAKEKNID